MLGKDARYCFQVFHGFDNAPPTSSVTVYDDDGAVIAIKTKEFGPFDTLNDMYDFLVGTLEIQLPLF